MAGRLSDLSPQEVASAIERNYVEAYRVLAVSYPGAHIIDRPDLFAFATGEETSLGNCIVQSFLDDDDASRVIDETLAYFNGRNLKTAWSTSASTTPAALPSLLIAAGGREVDMPAMAADLTELPSVVHPSQVHEVLDEVENQVWLQLMPPSFRTLLLRVTEKFGLGPESPMRNFIAYLNGEPVATSSLIVAGGEAGIYCVGTAPEARRQGIGAAVTLKAMAAAKEMGFGIIGLQSSKMGLPVYQRLGFREYGRIKHYVFNEEP
ncbi:MAG TPA: GNAT family N-acetyltransferase [Fimbriimonas sp.]|nr:GNAT family N-acetyltransferase [Fimbriimonas sp.]